MGSAVSDGGHRTAIRGRPSGGSRNAGAAELSSFTKTPSCKTLHELSSRDSMRSNSIDGP